MHISLIEITVQDTSAIGIRSLSAYLKKAGYQTQLIFLSNVGERDVSNRCLCPDHIIDQLIVLCKKSDLVGISFLTCGFHRAAQITKRLKEELDVLVVWGGVHATTEPEQCLNFADAVCRGEGEEALLELVQRIDAGRNFYDIHNFWFKTNGNIIKNPIRPLIQDLDKLPFADYDLTGEHFALKRTKNEFYPLDKSLLLEYITPKWHQARADIRKGPIYATMASRGCPLTCSYCIHSIYKGLYPRQRYIRRRSPEHIINELSLFINNYDFNGNIWFADDDFMAATTQDIEEFSEKYKDKIGLPFFCLAGPTTISEKKMKYLTDAGLQYFEFGIQSGSTKTKKIFNRLFSTEQIISYCTLINKFKDKIALPYYDFILDNPWETIEDKVETLDLILQIPKPYKLAMATFVYFPGSILYEEAKQNGTISLDSEQIYANEFTRLKGSYVDFLIIMYAYYKIPRIIIKYLSNRKLVTMLNRNFLAKFYTIPYKVYHKLIKWIL